MEKILVYEGKSTYGKVAFTIVGNKIYRGKRASGAQDFTIYNNRIYKGKSAVGTPLYTIDNYRIYPGKSKWGTPAFTIDNNKIFAGKSKWGKPAYTLDVSGMFRPKSFFEEISLFVEDDGERKAAKASNTSKANNAAANTTGNGKGSMFSFPALIAMILGVCVIWFCIEVIAPNKSQPKQQESVKTEDVSEPETEEAKVETKNSDEYIFVDSDSRLLTDDEVSGLSKEEIRYAINEIYARRGRIFEDSVLKEYFESKSWYEPKYKKDEFSDDVFNEFEKANINLLVKYR